VLGAAVLGAAVLGGGALDVTVAARAIQPGEVLVVTVTAPPSDAPFDSAQGRPVTVHAFDRDWPVYAVDKGRWRALVGIDLETRPGRYTIAVTSASGRAAHPVDVQRHVFPTRRLTVDPDLVNPPPEMRERIDRETRELNDAWRVSSADRLWSTFVRPVPDEANSAFGTRSFYNGEARSPHAGADFLSPAGRPVKAPAGGRVVLAGNRYFTGNTVVIDHGMGLFSLLAHLSEIDVQTGATVAAGDVVGKVGATGRVTGPHLHWTVRLNNTRVDPLSLLFVTASGGQAHDSRASAASESPERSEAAKRRASDGVGEVEGRSPSNKAGRCASTTPAWIRCRCCSSAAQQRRPVHDHRQRVAALRGIDRHFVDQE
jgi:murein DD-endopeptidase MepM/ murein hydrolase activator NlpD